MTSPYDMQQIQAIPDMVGIMISLFNA